MQGMHNFFEKLLLLTVENATLKKPNICWKYHTIAHLIRNNKHFVHNYRTELYNLLYTL